MNIFLKLFSHTLFFMAFLSVFFLFFWIKAFLSAVTLKSTVKKKKKYTRHSVLVCGILVPLSWLVAFALVFLLWYFFIFLPS